MAQIPAYIRIRIHTYISGIWIHPVPHMSATAYTVQIRTYVFSVFLAYLLVFGGISEHVGFIQSRDKCWEVFRACWSRLEHIAGCGCMPPVNDRWFAARTPTPELHGHDNMTHLPYTPTLFLRSFSNSSSTPALASGWRRPPAGGGSSPPLPSPAAGHPWTGHL